MDEKDIRSTLTEEERKRLEKIDRIDSNQKRKKVIIAVVTVALIAIFTLGTVFGARYILSYEGTADMPDKNAEIVLPDTEEKVLSDISAVKSAISDFSAVKLYKSFNVSVPDDSVSVEGGSEALKDYLGFVKSSLVDLISEEKNKASFEGTFGDDFSAFIPSIDFNISDVISAECAKNEEDENELEYAVTFRDFSGEKAASLPYSAVFGVDKCIDTADSIAQKLSSMADITDVKLSFSEPVFTVRRDSAADKLKSFEAKCICTVEANAEFKGSYAPLGSGKISFNVEEMESFDFTFAGLNFNSDVYYISKGDSDELKYSVVSDLSPSEVKIIWESSDPGVLSIDGNFYKAHKISDKPVYVTGTFDYCGKTYTAKCIYYVRKELEDVKLSAKELSLKVGETASLELKFKPADATIKAVRWFSEDESIAKVDENGNITAVSEGETSVYLISEDGNFRRACAVTVKEG